MRKDIEKSKIVQKVAERLKDQKITQPRPWSFYAKTGCHKSRPPYTRDWWYLRAASILKNVNELGPIGVSKLRTKYGGRKRRGHKPPKFRKSGGSIIRNILQDLEKAGLIEQLKNKQRKGRVITTKGRILLEK